MFISIIITFIIEKLGSVGPVQQKKQVFFALSKSLQNRSLTNLKSL